MNHHASLVYSETVIFEIFEIFLLLKIQGISIGHLTQNINNLDFEGLIER